MSWADRVEQVMRLIDEVARARPGAARGGRRLRGRGGGLRRLDRCGPAPMDVMSPAERARARLDEEVLRLSEPADGDGPPPVVRCEHLTRRFGDRTAAAWSWPPSPPTCPPGSGTARRRCSSFLFICSLTGGAAMIGSRRLGIHARMPAPPPGPGAIGAGESAPSLRLRHRLTS